MYDLVIFSKWYILGFHIKWVITLTSEFIKWLSLYKTKKSYIKDGNVKFGLYDAGLLDLGFDAFHILPPTRKKSHFSLLSFRINRFWEKALYLQTLIGKFGLKYFPRF